MRGFQNLRRPINTLMKTFRQYLREATLDQPGMFYHATLSTDNGKSFYDGIDLTRAKGYGQGKGFYVWQTREAAVRHAEQLSKGNVTKQVDVDGTPILVVLNLPLSTKYFDIDFEAEADKIVPWLFQHIAQIEPLVGKTFGAGAPSIKFGPMKVGDSYNFSVKKSDNSTGGIGLRATVEPGDANAAYGETLNAFLQVIQLGNPRLFDKFEQDLLPQALAVKLNNAELQNIKPTQIETLDGTVVWKNPSPKIIPA